MVVACRDETVPDDGDVRDGSAVAREYLRYLTALFHKRDVAVVLSHDVLARGGVIIIICDILFYRREVCLLHIPGGIGDEVRSAFPEDVYAAVLASHGGELRLQRHHAFQLQRGGVYPCERVG